MSQIHNATTRPRQGTEARKVTDKRGGAIEPHNATPRQKTAGRTQKDENVRVIQGVPTGIEPQNTRGKSNGSHLTNTIASKMQRTPKVWRKSGDSKSTVNPIK